MIATRRGATPSRKVRGVLASRLRVPVVIEEIFAVADLALEVSVLIAMAPQASARVAARYQHGPPLPPKPVLIVRTVVLAVVSAVFAREKVSMAQANARRSLPEPRRCRAQVGHIRRPALQGGVQLVVLLKDTVPGIGDYFILLLPGGPCELAKVYASSFRRHH
jgi:hypothetical protein